MSKFIILAIARNVSTSLARLLNASRVVELAIEPFNPDYTQWYPGEPNYIKRVKDEASLDKVADELFSRFTAIKTLNYQLDTKLYEHLALRTDMKVIMLYRKNVVKSVLSAEIAKQTNAWHKEDLNTAAKEVYSRLKPVNVDLITEYTNFISSQHTQLLNFLKNNKPNKYIELVYEELYSEDSEKNVQTITEICEFLNIAKPEMEFIDKYMKVSNAKVNNSEQYKMIPNFEEISRKFSV